MKSPLKKDNMKPHLITFLDKTTQIVQLKELPPPPWSNFLAYCAYIQQLHLQLTNLLHRKDFYSLSTTPCNNIVEE